jgi:hypothetical protein
MDEFYVGYQPQAPRGLARLMRRVIVAIVAAAALIALALVLGQQPFAPGFFEFGNAREFEGVVRTMPFPALQIEKAGGVEQYVLVAEGKHGADSMVAGLDGMRVRLRGTLIRREGMAMLEVVANSLHVSSQTVPSAAEPEDLGVQTLSGEIVDSKCYLGVMNPGQTKPHRDCAVRCISGGVPPLFVARDATGRTARLWLVGADGAAVNRQLLDWVAEPVEIAGHVVRRGDQLIFRADPAMYRRIR